MADATGIPFQLTVQSGLSLFRFDSLIIGNHCPYRLFAINQDQSIKALHSILRKNTMFQLNFQAIRQAQPDNIFFKWLYYQAEKFV